MTLQEVQADAKVLGKKRNARKKPEGKGTQHKRGVLIPIDDLRVHDKLVTGWIGDVHHRGELSLNEANEALHRGTRWVAKSVQVDSIDICEGKWRTHIHVNKKDCYDLRFSNVWIVERS